MTGSPRIRRLRGIAMQVAAQRVLGVQLPLAEAETLAAAGSLQAALDALRARLAIKRVAPGLSPTDEQAQLLLAAGEVAVQLTAPPEDATRQKAEFVARAVEHFRQASTATSAAQAQRAALESVMAQLKAHSADTREYRRRLDRAYRLAQNALHRQVLDPAVLAEAQLQLDTLLLDYLRRGIRVADPVAMRA